jgi:hypothetical protein
MNTDPRQFRRRVKRNNPQIDTKAVAGAGGDDATKWPLDASASLSANVVIDGAAGTHSLTFEDLLDFIADVTAINLRAAANVNILADEAMELSAQTNLVLAGVDILSLQSSSSFRMRTPAVVAATAIANYPLLLTNATTGQAEFAQMALAALAQSGATSNQVPSWNGSAWVPVTPATGIGGSTGATTERVLVADGTGGATLKATPVTIDTSGNITGAGSITCTAFVIDQTTYSGRTLNRLMSDGTNEAVVLGPSGTGYVSRDMPDGGAGGNQRGNYATDFGTRTGVGQATAVASGAYAFNAGLDNIVSGSYSGSLGLSNTVSQSYSYGFGNTNTVSGFWSVCFGRGVSVTSNFAFAAGDYHSVTGEGGSAFGRYASAYLRGMQSLASGLFAATGDNQGAHVVAFRATSDATPSNLFLDGSSSRIVVPVNSSGLVQIMLVGRTNTAGGKWATAVRQVSWNKGTTAGSMTISALDTIGTDRGSNAGAWPAGWAFNITADTTNGAIDLQVTGEAATNIRWSAVLRWGEDTFA